MAPLKHGRAAPPAAAPMFFHGYPAVAPLKHRLNRDQVENRIFPCLAALVR